MPNGYGMLHVNSIHAHTQTLIGLQEKSPFPHYVCKGLHNQLGTSTLRPRHSDIGLGTGT